MARTLTNKALINAEVTLILVKIAHSLAFNENHKTLNGRPIIAYYTPLSKGSIDTLSEMGIEFEFNKKHTYKFYLPKKGTKLYKKFISDYESMFTQAKEEKAAKVAAIKEAKAEAAAKKKAKALAKAEKEKAAKEAKKAKALAKAEKEKEKVKKAKAVAKAEKPTKETKKVKAVAKAEKNVKAEKPAKETKKVKAVAKAEKNVKAEKPAKETKKVKAVAKAEKVKA